VEACGLDEGFGKRLWMGEVGEMGIFCDYFQKHSLNTFPLASEQLCNTRAKPRWGWVIKTKSSFYPFPVLGPIARFPHMVYPSGGAQSLLVTHARQ